MAIIRNENHVQILPLFTHIIMFSTFTRFYYDTEDKSYNLLPYEWLLLDHGVL